MDKEDIMKKTIKLAINTIQDNNTPFGAIITKGNEIIAEASNEVFTINDVTAHAEILAIRKATNKLGKTDLSECELFASGEPCVMCLSAIYYTGIKNVNIAYTQEEAFRYNLGSPYVHKQITLPKERRDITYTLITPQYTKHPYQEWKKRGG